MKKMIFILLSIAVLLTSCSNAALQSDVMKKTQEAVSPNNKETPFNTDKSDSAMEYVVQKEQVDLGSGIQSLILMCEEADEYIRDYYLALETDNNSNVKYSLSSDTDVMISNADFCLADLDGDTVPEIIVRVCYDSSGGIGSFAQSILAVKDGGFKELLSINSEINTGFEGTTENGKIIITNRYTGYKREIVNKNNETNLNDIAVDSCAYFVPINAYAEGTCQIAALQYVSYYSHSDCIGYAASILSYDKDDGKLKVIDAKLYTEDELIIKDNQIYGWLKTNTLS